MDGFTGVLYLCEQAVVLLMGLIKRCFVLGRYDVCSIGDNFDSTSSMTMLL